MIERINNWIKRKIWKAKHPCMRCEYLMCISNFSPCYGCRDNDKFEEAIGAVRNER